MPPHWPDDWSVVVPSTFSRLVKTIGCDAVPTLWDGGCRAGGAEWESASYTREGLADVSRLTHSLQGKYA